MSEKVVLPKEVAKAIENVWSSKENTHVIKHLYLTNWTQMNRDNFIYEGKILSKFAEYSPITYMTALVEGYEVEKTKEEKVIELFCYTSSHFYRQAVRETLDALEIKIEGINK